MEISLQALEFRYEKLRIRRLDQEKRLLISLGEAGQQSPVIVVTSCPSGVPFVPELCEGAARETGRYVVIDGHKRIRALKKLKEDTAKTVVWDMSEDQALAAWYRMSRSGSSSAFEEGWLIVELYRVWKWGLGTIAQRLSRSTSWCSKRLALVEEMPEWMAAEVAGGAIGAHAAASYLVPLTRVNAQDGKVLAEKIRGLGLSNRQIRDICQSYRLAGVEVRKKIAADPSLFLKAQAAARLGPQDPALSEPENRALKNLDLIGNVSLGLVRLWPQVMNYDTPEGAREKLSQAWTRNRKRYGLLEEAAAVRTEMINTEATKHVG